MANTRRPAVLLTMALGAAILVGAAPPGPAAAADFPTITGVDARYYPQDPTCTEHCGPGPELLLTMTSARTLTVTCASNGAIVVNKVTTPANCTTLYFLAAYGSAGNDSATIDLTKGAVPVRLELRAGNDTGVVKTHSNGEVYGESGDDKISTLLYLPASGLTPYVTGTLSGDTGRDTLTNLGYGPGTVPAGDPLRTAVNISGDAGADTVIGSATRPDVITAEWIDQITFNGGPGEVTLTVGANSDTVNVALNGNYGPKVTVRSGTTTKTFTLPTLTSRLQVLTGQGNDTVTVDHRSSRTEVVVDGGGGTGDKITVLPSLASTNTGATVTQPAPWQPISWNAFESVTVRQVPRP